MGRELAEHVQRVEGVPADCLLSISCTTVHFVRQLRTMRGSAARGERRETAETRETQRG